MTTLNAQTMAALEEWNIRKFGQGMSSTNAVTLPPEIAARLAQLAWPGEDPNETIMRLIGAPGSARQ